MKQAGYTAEIDRAAALSHQAGPLSEAQARQEVVVQETRVAELEAQREEQRLQASVRKPADARAYEQITLARADRDAAISGSEARARQVELEAAANAQPVKIMAEAEAIKARADALAENQDAVIGQQLAERWPEIVEAAAKPFGNIDNLTVLNSATGLSEALASAMSQGVAGLQLARNLLSPANQSPAPTSVPAAEASTNGHVLPALEVPSER